MAEISVIVPVYNCEQTIDKCIDSVLQQSFKDWELILVNDGSIDRSGEICCSYAKMDDRITVIEKENGGGAGEARNAGILKATSPFLCFIDSDDWIDYVMLEHLYNAQKEKDYDIVICGYHNIINEAEDSYNSETVSENREVIGQQDVRDYFVKYYPEGMVGYPWNKMYRTSLIRDNHLQFPKMRRLEDGIFNTEVFERAKSCRVLEEALYNYRVGGQVELRKLPKDFYVLVEKFVLQYYDKLENWGYDIRKCEGPILYYFLNDFVCCLENVCYGSNKVSLKEQRKYMNMLHNNQLIQMMLLKDRQVPRYSKIILKLFENKYYVILRGTVNLKVFLKVKLSRFFLALKRKWN